MYQANKYLIHTPKNDFSKKNKYIVETQKMNDTNKEFNDIYKYSMFCRINSSLCK